MTENKVAVEQIDRDRLLNIIALWELGRKQEALEQVARHRTRALEASQAGVEAERVARAMDPALWSDDAETAHMAASPIQVCYARERSIERARQYLVEYAALTTPTQPQEAVDRYPMPKVPELFEHGEALDWITANCMAIRRDNGNMDYSLGAMIAAYEAGKAATPTRIEAAQPEEAALITYARLWWERKMPSHFKSADIKGDGRVDVHWADSEESGKYTLPVDFVSEVATPPQAAESGLLDEVVEVIEKLKAAGHMVLSAMDDYNAANGTHLGGPAFFEIGRAIHSADALLAKAGKQGEGDREG